MIYDLDILVTYFVWVSGFQTGVPGYLETEKSSSSLNLNLNLHYHYQGSGDCQMSTLAMRHFVPLWRLIDSWAQSITGIILCMRPANERRRYNVTSSPIGWAHTQNDPCMTYRWDYPIYRGLVTPYSTRYLVNNVLGNGLLHNGTKHYLNQCWLTNNKILWHSFHCNDYLNNQDTNS